MWFAELVIIKKEWVCIQFKAASVKFLGFSYVSQISETLKSKVEGDWLTIQTAGSVAGGLR